MSIVPGQYQQTQTKHKVLLGVDRHPYLAPYNISNERVEANKQLLDEISKYGTWSINENKYSFATPIPTNILPIPSVQINSLVPEPSHEEPRYIAEINPTIGGGSSGTARLFRAVDTHLGRRVVVKIIQDDPGKERDIQKRDQDELEMEAKTMGRLVHPNIPSIFDYTHAQAPGNKDPKPVIIMEYVQGNNLREILASGKFLEPNQIIELATQIGSAIDYLDSEHIHHGDIKIAQIMRTEHGFKLLDFGSSKFNSQPATTISIGYSPPEIVTFKSNILNSATEEFSFAASLYAMVTGQLVYNEKESPYCTLDTFPLTSDDLIYKLPRSSVEELNKIFMKALNTDPSKRYNSSSTFAEDFNKIMIQSSVKKE